MHHMPNMPRSLFESRFSSRFPSYLHGPVAQWITRTTGQKIPGSNCGRIGGFGRIDSRHISRNDLESARHISHSNLRLAWYFAQRYLRSASYFAQQPRISVIFRTATLVRPSASYSERQTYFGVHFSHSNLSSASYSERQTYAGVVCRAATLIQRHRY